MSASVGWATLQVIPSAKGFTKALQKEIQGPAGKVGDDLGSTLSRRAAAPVAKGIAEAVDKGAKDGAPRLKRTLHFGVSDAMRSGFRRGFVGLFSLSQEQGGSFRRSLAFGVAGGLIEGAKRGFEALMDGAKNFFQFLNDAGRAAGQATFAALTTAIQGAGTTIATGGLNLIAGALVAIGSALPAVATGFVTLAPALFLAGGAAGSLFTILAGGIGALAVFKLGTHGLGAALSEVSKEGKATNETLKGLSPNAKKFVHAFEGIQKPLTSLRKFVQDKLLAGMDSQLKGLFKSWRGPLKSMLGDLATKFNGVFKEVGKALGNPEFISRMKTAFAGFGDFIERIGKSMPGLIDAFGRLAAGSVPFLKELGKGLGGVVDKFAKWIKDAEKSGALSDFMTDAAQALKDIWAIGGLVFGILGEIVGILFPSSKKTSTSVLGGVKDALQSVKDWLGDEKNQAKLKNLINDIGAFVKKAVTEWIPKAIEFGKKVSEWVAKAEEWGRKISDFKKKVEEAWASIQRKIAVASAVIKGAILGITSPISTAIAAFKRLRDGASRQFDSLVALVRGLPGRILRALGSVGGLLFGAGAQIASGLVAGMRSKMGLVTGMGSALGRAAASAARAALDIHSPSRVFMKIGGHTAEGMALGISRGTSKVTRAMGALTAVPDPSRGAWGAHSAPTAAPVMSPTINLHNTRATAAQVAAVLERQAILARLGRAR